MFRSIALAATLPLAVSAAHAATETVLYSFTGGVDGATPAAGVIADAAGNLYGTTQAGGGAGQGVVFKLAPDGTETVIHDFADGKKDGGRPSGGVVLDKNGNLYGVTVFGGKSDQGVVYAVAPDGTLTLLHAFKGESVGDGARPVGRLLLDRKGNIFGTTAYGGSNCVGGGTCGTVYEITHKGREKVLARFTGSIAQPQAGLIADKSGNLYGTSYAGGPTFTLGAAFKLAPDGTVSTLHGFIGAPDGANPAAPLVAGPDGTMYGTTYFGGACGNCGTVFSVTPDGVATILHDFTAGGDGLQPLAGLILDKADNLYGTTSAGGSANKGTVFKLAPDGTETLLYSFTGGADGGVPQAEMLADKKFTHLYGTTSQGGTHGVGTVFKISLGN